MNSLGWSRREEPANTSQQNPLLGTLNRLNPFSNEGFVRLPTVESEAAAPGAPLPARTRREEEEGWFARKSALSHTLTHLHTHAHAHLSHSRIRTLPPLAFQITKASRLPSILHVCQAICASSIRRTWGSGDALQSLLALHLRLCKTLSHPAQRVTVTRSKVPASCWTLHEACTSYSRPLLYSTCLSICLARASPALPHGSSSETGFD